MATAQSIRGEMSALSELVLELQVFADVSVDLAGDQPSSPEWPWLVSQHARRLTDAARSLDNSLCQHLASREV